MPETKVDTAGNIDFDAIMTIEDPTSFPGEGLTDPPAPKEEEPKVTPAPTPDPPAGSQEGENEDVKVDDPPAGEELEDDSTISFILSQLGEELDEGVSFEDTEKGVADLVAYVAERRAKKIQEDTLERHPQAKQFMDYLDAGGDPDMFYRTMFPEVDYSKVEIAEENEALQERILFDDLVRQGYSEEDIQAELDEAKASGTLKTRSERALKILSKNQQQSKDYLIQQQKEIAQRQQEETQKFWTDITQTIKSANEFAGIPVKQTDKIKFADYLSKPIKDGKSQRDLDVEQMTLEQRLAVDYVLFSDFKLSDIIARAATTTATRSLKDKLRKDERPSGTRQKTTTGQGEIASGF